MFELFIKQIHNIGFSNHYTFLLLFVYIPIYFFYKKNKKGINFLNIDLLKEVYKKSSTYYKLRLMLIYLILFFLILTLSGPYLNEVYFKQDKEGIDISIVLDISKSMLAEDIKPSRLDAAKSVLNNFIDGLQDNRASLVVFAGKPFVLSPLTFEHTFLKDYISKINTSTINQNIPGLSGTAIGDSIIRATDTLDIKSDIKREKVIILVTDGEANLGIDPKLALKYAQDKNIIIYTIGIGSKDGMELYVTDRFGNKQYFLDENGDKIIAKLDEDLLTKIANSTNGEYYNVNSKNTLEKVFESINKINKTKIKHSTLEVKKYLGNYLIILIYVLLLLFLLINFKLRKKQND